MSVINSNVIKSSIKFKEEGDITNKLNKKTLYKWNISKRTGFYLILNIIINILKERNDKKIKLDELSILINKRYKENYNYIIKKHKKPKSLYNFLKVEFNGINNITDIYLYNIMYIKNDHIFLLNTESMKKDLKNDLKKDLKKTLKNESDNDNYLFNWYYITDEEIPNI